MYSSHGIKGKIPPYKNITEQYSPDAEPSQIIFLNQLFLFT